ncbi:MAG TPA: exodeoxyribonuclease VII large subunit [Clostridia bacterium]|nr:exodeoxyribonuclease VII large subunit [Clostridia bacterium]
MNNKIFKVSELSAFIKHLLDNHPVLSSVWVRGEIANFKHHSSGHLYFSLKDEQSNVRVVMFRSRARNLNFKPENGLDCLVRGYISLYPRETALQLYAEEIVPAGIGLQSIALAKLKEKLQKKGYFAPERKKPLPLLPQGIGIISSPVGAALQDISKVVWRRYPGMYLLLYPALVQGEGAVEDVVQGIKVLNTREDIDLIIIARGGGSAEDLQAFNSELIATAIFNSTKPVVSAIGHEIDLTIADLVADLRAATPSMAGELVVPVRVELENNLIKKKERLHHLINTRLDKEKMKLSYLAEMSLLKRPERWLDQYREGLAKLADRLNNCGDFLINNNQQQLALVAGKLQSLSPLATLARGYSICKHENGDLLINANQVKIAEKILVQLHQGLLKCSVLQKEENIGEKKG